MIVYDARYHLRLVRCNEPLYSILAFLWLVGILPLSVRGAPDSRLQEPFTWEPCDAGRYRLLTGSMSPRTNLRTG